MGMLPPALAQPQLRQIMALQDTPGIMQMAS